MTRHLIRRIHLSHPHDVSSSTCFGRVSASEVAPCSRTHMCKSRTRAQPAPALLRHEHGSASRKSPTAPDLMSVTVESQERNRKSKAKPKVTSLPATPRSKPIFLALSSRQVAPHGGRPSARLNVTPAEFDQPTTDPKQTSKKLFTLSASAAANDPAKVRVLRS